jgi:hypothetical protein
MVGGSSVSCGHKAACQSINSEADDDRKTVDLFYISVVVKDASAIVLLVTQIWGMAISS